MAEPVKKPRRKREHNLVHIKSSHPLKDYGDEFTGGEICSTHELIALLKEDKTTQIEARVFGVDKEGKPCTIEFKDKKDFIEAFERNEKESSFKLREAFDGFGTDYDGPVGGGGVGKDYIPMLGGPFNRQQYLNSMLKGHQESFFAFHHDPIAREAISIIKNFTLGRGWRVDCKDPKAMVIWKAFEEANNLQSVMEYLCIELALYGETFVRWLPNQAFNAYKVAPEQTPPKTILPRVRLLDPSTVWEIITYPEDMSRVLAYQLVYPTQYSIYTTSDKGKPVAGTKFIYEQIQPEEVDHYKINVVSNEKRGRGDLFPVLGYMKRLRDSVNYSIIGLQKTTAWSIDTIVEGNQGDIDNYIQQMEALGAIAPAGSEFVHSKKIERKYLSNEGSSKSGGSQAFDWCMSMICSGLGIPIQYFGTHMSGQGTRGNALVATEPVAKKFEARQLVLERVIKKMAERLFKQFKIEADIEVTFPDIVSSDRSSKLKDLAQAQSMGWLSQERAAEIAAKELGITDFEYQIEKAAIDAQQQGWASSPLTAPPELIPDYQDSETEPEGVTSEDRESIRQNRGF